MGQCSYSSTTLELGTRQRRMVSFMFRLHLPRKKSRRYTLYRKSGGPQERSEHCGEEKKSCPCREQKPRSSIYEVKSQSYPCNRPRRQMGLWDVEVHTFARPSAHRWRWGCHSQAPAVLNPQRRFLVLISVRGWVDPRATVRLEGLGQLKNQMTSSGIEPDTFRIAVECLNQLRYRVPPQYICG
jgi:hypothetical protein